MTGAEAYDYVLGRIVATVVDGRSKEDRLWHYQFDPGAQPDLDRCFTLVPVEHPRETLETGCNRKRLVLDLSVSYRTYEGWVQRMLRDGDELIDTIWTLMLDPGIVDVQEQLSTITTVESYAIYTRLFQVDYYDTP